jgi:nitroreductase
MTIEEAIKLRHSVRRYLPKPLTTDQEKALQKK